MSTYLKHVEIIKFQATTKYDISFDNPLKIGLPGSCEPRIYYHFRETDNIVFVQVGFCASIRIIIL